MSKIRKSAKYKGFIIEQEAETNKVSVVCKNTSQVLRDIADEIGMSYESDWGPYYLGSRLINFINGVDTTRKPKAESEEQATKTFDENNLISDEDWNWWVSLSDPAKYVLISNLEYKFKNEISEEYLSWDDDDELQSDVDLNDRNVMGNFVATYMTGYYDKEGEFDYSQALIGIEIPDDVFNFDDLDKFSYLKYLERVSFYYNELDEILEGTGKLTQIDELSLERNEITEESLGELSTLTQLTSLNLSSNMLAGKAEAYEPLTKLINLVDLNLSCNRLDSESVGILEKIAQIPELYKLDLSINELDGHDFSPLSQLESLQELNLYSCVTITDDLLKTLSTFPALEKLNLECNEVAVNEFGIDLSQLTSLKELTLNYKSVSAELLSAVVTIPNLEKLILNDMASGGEIIAKALDRVSFSKLVHLKELKLDEVDISANTLSEISKLSNLESLKLKGAYDGSNAIEQFDCQHLVNLKSLDLSQRPVTASVLAQIATLPNLESLNLENTSIDISWDEFALLQQMPKLSSLDITKNNISSDQFVYLEGFTNSEKTYFSLSVTEWRDEELKESEAYKKLDALFDEKYWSLS